MTGYTVHTGSTIKFSNGWDRVFSGKAAARKSQAKKTAGKKSKSKRRT